VIPDAICAVLGLQEGDFVEVTSPEGVVDIKSKKLLDADDITYPGRRKGGR
jgi:hypothetical protein